MTNLEVGNVVARLPEGVVPKLKELSLGDVSSLAATRVFFSKEGDKINLNIGDMGVSEKS